MVRGPLFLQVRVRVRVLFAKYAINKKLNLPKILNSCIEKNDHKFILYILVLYYELSSLRKKSLTSIASFSYLDALLEIKCQHFEGEESEGFELKCGVVSVADGTTKEIDHLTAAVCVTEGQELFF